MPFAEACVGSEVTGEDEPRDHSANAPGCQGCAVQSRPWALCGGNLGELQKTRLEDHEARANATCEWHFPQSPRTAQEPLAVAAHAEELRQALEIRGRHFLV